MREGILLFLFACSISAFGQQAELDTVIISTNKSKSTINAISSKEIAFIQPNDVGEIIQKLPGMTIKNYGGIGGMKTVSVRGLGSVYQQIVVDGFAIPNTQTGMVDLGTIYASDISTVALIPGSFTNEYLPVSAILSANTLMIQRERNSKKMYSLKTHFKYGSFNTLDGYLSNRFCFKEKHSLSIDGSYRSSRGDYPYRLKNYQQEYTGRRKNSDIQEVNANLRYNYRISEELDFSADYSYTNYDKGLPGAVILYLNSVQQRLFGSSHRANTSLGINYFNWKGKVYASYINDELTYLDEGYLNVQGFLQSNYCQQQLQVGGVLRNRLYRMLYQNYGVEFFGARLTGDISENVQPNRIQVRFYYQLMMDFRWGNVKAQIAGQSLNDFNRKEAIGQSTVFVQPAFFIDIHQDWPVIGDMMFFAKRSVRVPGFNDLYYNQVGNLNLRSEKANQFQMSFNKRYLIQTSAVEYGANAYFNQEEDKIVAIPTKNLFVWMIQNVGKVHVLGTDVQFRYIHYLKDWNWSVSTNYTYQSVTNRTDKNSSTFGHQIAYYPEHIANLDVSAAWKGFGISVTTFGVSKRYALNENIPSNEVEGYITADVQVFYHWKVKDIHQLTFRAMCKNIGNLSYAYVKYYVMPGINYLFSVEYEF